MSRPARLALSALGIVLVCAPVSLMATLALLPFWSWLEASTWVESVGHSGPAEWCYVVTFVVLLAVAAVALGLLGFRRVPPEDDGSPGLMVDDVNSRDDS